MCLKKGIKYIELPMRKNSFFQSKLRAGFLPGQLATGILFTHCSDFLIYPPPLSACRFFVNE